MMKLYLITYESAHWCGASDTKVVVEASSAEDAEDKASDYMEEEMRALFADEYEDDDYDYESESAYSVTSVEEFTPKHQEWKYRGSHYYPEI